MSKNPILVITLTLFVGLLFVLAAANCGTPIVPDTQAGEVYVACNFSFPWSWLFGGGLQYYQFNIYLCLAVPTIIIVVLYLRAAIKRKDE